MAKRNKRIKCKTCGTILSSEARVEMIVKDADKALERFYKKYTRKKK